MKCIVCGSEIPSDSDFCPVCGAWNIPIPENGLDTSGALLTNEEFHALESEALKSPIERDLEEFAKAYMRELEGANPQELGEVEVVKPEVLARWKTFLPEPVINIVVRHHNYVMSTREVEKWIEVPDFAYLMPELPEIVEAPRAYAMAIDTDGWLRVRVRLGRDTIGRTRERRRIYRRIFYTPEVAFETDTLELTMNIATALGVTIAPLPPRLPKRRPSFRATARYARAVRATYLTEPHLIKLENIRKANEILNLYKGSTTITIARDKTL